MIFKYCIFFKLKYSYLLFAPEWNYKFLTIVTMSQSCIQFPKAMVLKLWSLHPPHHITLELVRNSNSHVTLKDLPNEKFWSRGLVGPASTSLQLILTLKFTNPCPIASNTMPEHTITYSIHSHSINIYRVATACLALYSGYSAGAETPLPPWVWRPMRQTDSK